MSDDVFSMEGKTVIVTGASYGFGVTWADALSERGANIVGTSRSLDRLGDTAAMVEAKGRRFLPVACDVTDYEQVENLMKAAWDEFGTVDVLINNAGISDLSAWRAEHSDNDMFRQIVETDLTGLWHCCRAAAQYFLRQGHGNIINLSSIFGVGGFEGRTPGYFAAKGGVTRLTEFLATEWGDRGIRVNALAPTVFDTPMTHDGLIQSGVMEMLEGRTPMRRIGQTEDLVGPIVFLASDASQYVTGAILPLDGGLTASRGYSPGPWPMDEFDPEGRGKPINPGDPWE